MKRVLALVLVFALCLSPALAAEASPFADVAAGSWYADAVAVCYEAGWMRGTGENQFSPLGVMAVSEAATLAARILAERNGQTIDTDGASIWYQPYLLYLAQNDITTPEATATATRQDFFDLLSAVVPESDLPAINAIETLPDTQDEGVLRFYNAGILTGTDSYGTFNAAGTLTRAECAAMLARVLRPELRQSFTPLPKPSAPTDPSEGLTYAEELAQTVAVKVNGQDVTMARLVGYLNQLVYNADYTQYVSTGQRLNWDVQYSNIPDLSAYFIQRAVDAAVQYALMEQQARALGCQVEELAQWLTPSPSQDVLSAYAESMDLLGAKHILISTTDPSNGGQIRSDEEAKAIADTVLEGLNQNPNYQQFDNLMSLYNEDPGMQSYPQGYLFTKGEMVEEFENAVRALTVNTYTLQPVKSSYGYHIILRVDPTQMDELTERYQQQVLSTLLDTWMSEATVTTNDVMLGQLNVRANYEAYLAAQS